MESVDYGNPAYDNNYEFECGICGKPIPKEGLSLAHASDITISALLGGVSYLDIFGEKIGRVIDHE